MTIADGRGRGRVTFRWERRTVAIQRKWVVSVRRGSQMRHDLEIEFANIKRPLWFGIGENAEMQEYPIEVIAAIESSFLYEDIDVVWDFSTGVARRTPDR